MTKKSFVRKTQRTIVGAAKSSAAHIQKAKALRADARRQGKSSHVGQSEKHRARRHERNDVKGGVPPS